MRNRIAYHLIYVVLITASLADLSGCSPKTPDVALTLDLKNKMMTDFKNGDAMLDCGIACSWAYITRLPKIEAEYRAKDWSDLAMDLIRIGNKTDVGYYLLGRAAEGLGYYEASAKYFETSSELSTTILYAKCRSGGDTCVGAILPRDIYPHLSDVRSHLGNEGQLSQARDLNGNITSFQGSVGGQKEVAVPPQTFSPKESDVTSAEAQQYPDKVIQFVAIPDDIGCTLASPTFRGNETTNGGEFGLYTVEGVTCWLKTNPAVKKSIPLESLQVVNGLLETTNFGNLQVIGEPFSGIAMKIYNTELGSFRAFLKN